MGGVTVLKNVLALIATMTGLLMSPAAASDTVLLHAAGSLRGALAEVSQAFEKSVPFKVQAKFGASGLLKDEIAGGARAEVFASANMEHPRALAAAKKSGPVVLFARNKLCALVRPGLAVTSDTLLERMLDPQVKLGTSTPKADPSGDYPSKPSARRRRSAAMPDRFWRRRRCSSRAAPTAPRRRAGATRTAGTSPKAGPTCSWPIAPPRAMRARRMPNCNRSPCRTPWPSARIMV